MHVALASEPTAEATVQTAEAATWIVEAMVVFQISKDWHTVAVFGDWATQQTLQPPLLIRGKVDQPPVIRGGWFNKCQRLAHAVLSEDWDLAWETADNLYAGPAF